MKSIKISFLDYNKLLEILSVGIKRTMWIIAKDAFVVILISVLICILFGEFLFYNYILALDVKKTDAMPVVKFNESAYNSVMKESNKKESVFNDVFSSEYQNPFY